MRCFNACCAIFPCSAHQYQWKTIHKYFTYSPCEKVPLKILRAYKRPRGSKLFSAFQIGDSIVGGSFPSLVRPVVSQWLWHVLERQFWQLPSPLVRETCWGLTWARNPSSNSQTEFFSLPPRVPKGARARKAYWIFYHFFVPYLDLSSNDIFNLKKSIMQSSVLTHVLAGTIVGIHCTQKRRK